MGRRHVVARTLWVVVLLLKGLGFIEGRQMLVVASSEPHELTQEMHRYGEEELRILSHEAAHDATQVLRAKRTAVVVLATGQEMEGFYQELVLAFQKDKTLDLSQGYFFLMDEYEGLEDAHPLSNRFFFKTHFLDPLHEIDPLRAPCQDHCFYPGQRAPTGLIDDAFWQDFLMEHDCAGPDLVVMTLGAAYPVRSPLGTLTLKGGRVGAVEPDMAPSDMLLRIMLSDHRRGELDHRYKALARLVIEGHWPALKEDGLTVPRFAWSLTPISLVGAGRILILATGEDKGPVLKNVLEKEVSTAFPASSLSRLTQVSWYVDEGASGQLAETAWENGHLSGEHMVEALCHASLGCKGKPLILSHSFPEEKITCDRVLLQTTHTHLQEALGSCLTTQTWPEGKRILVLSPHPDDDVISMGASLVRLKERGNRIHVLYAVTGANAVRETLPTYAQAYRLLTDFLPEGDKKRKSVTAKALVREWEAIQATSLLGLPSQNLIFFKADYYERRGIPGLSPFSDHDIMRMKTILRDLEPEIIFFAAENDPNGAHGLSTQLLATALDALVRDQELSPPLLYGYRGAYNEWALRDPESLLVVPFNESLQDLKIGAIKAHVSQLEPLYPSFDPRPFFQRAKDRNVDSCEQLSSLMGYAVVDPVTGQKAEGAEVFKRKEFKRFLDQYL